MLAQTRVAVVNEAIRYFRSIDSEWEARHAMRSEDTARLYGRLLEEGCSAVQGLRQGLADLQPFLQNAQAAKEKWRDEHRKRYLEVMDRIPVVWEPGQVKGIADLFPEVARLEEDYNRQRAAALQKINDIAKEYPIIWRIYDMPPDCDKVTLGERIMEELQSTLASNLSLDQKIVGDAGLIWRFPPLVLGFLAEQGVDQYSIVWSACAARLAEEKGPSTAVNVLMINGLVQLGVAGFAFLAGAAVAPPVAFAIFLADLVASLADAYEEYQSYRLQDNAYQAVLDPGKSIATDPSLLAMLFTVGLDLLSVLPPAEVTKSFTSMAAKIHPKGAMK